MPVAKRTWALIFGVILGPVAAGAWLAFRGGSSDTSPDTGDEVSAGPWASGYRGDAWPDPLFWAAARGGAPCVRRLLREGVAADSGVGKGWTPLHIAALCGYVDVARLLLEAGADPQAATGNLITPLHCACQGGHAMLVRLLVDHGADPNARAADGRTPLHKAASYGHPGCIEALAEVGVGLNPRDADRYTPLDYAVQNEHAEAAATLHALGGRRGATPRPACQADGEH